MYADYNLVTNNNINYTIDMLRLKTSLTYKEFLKLEEHLHTFFYKIIKSEYKSSSISEFKNNFVIEVKEGESYWFGFQHNSELINNPEGLNSKFNFTIEFNPNKCSIKGFLKHILNLSTDWIIKSIDMAMDLKINILDLCGLDKGRKKDFRMFTQGQDNRTYYMGRTNNRIKIYNKKIESNLDYDLTRVEITSKLDLNIKDLFFYKYDILLPDLYLNNYLYSFADYKDRTLLAVLYAVQSGFNINDLSRDYKKRIKSLLEGNYKINLDNNSCTVVLNKCISYIFPYYKNK